LARGQKTALAFPWFMPLIARTVAEHTLVPLGVPHAAWCSFLISKACRGGHTDRSRMAIGGAADQ